MDVVSTNASNFTLTTKCVVIDSRDRDMRLFPSVAQYDVSLDEEIQDVTALELIAADVPMVSYTVTPKNNSLVLAAFDAAPTNATVALDVGDYTAATLATELEARLCATVPAVPDAFRVMYRTRLDNFEVRCKRPCVLAFAVESPHKVTYAPRSAARLLGFGAATYASVSAPDPGNPGYPHVITSVFRCDLTTDRYAILNIDPAHVNYGPTNTAIDQSFAIVPRTSCSANLSCDETRKKVFRPPIARFGKLRISFTDADGDPYDFHNRDHRIELRFTMIKQKKYSQHLFAPFES